MQVVDSEGYLKVKLVGGPVGPFVPYTGATANVNLGEYEIKAGQFTLDTSPTGTAVVGTTRWNDSIGSSETTLKGGSVILKNGVDLVARVVNKVTPNATLTKANYTAVRISGAQGQRLAVAYAQANNDANSADTIGLVTETIPTNQEGFIITVGNLEGVNTTGALQGETWADGDVLYLSPTTPGAITNIKPTGLTGHIIVIGYVEYAHAINGKIYVKIMNGWELDELHNVYINPATLANNNILQYDSADQLWKNKVLSTGITIGSTAIASGVVGRVLFEGAGNVVQESSSLFWDNTNARLGIGTSTPAEKLDIHNQGKLRLGTSNTSFFSTINTDEAVGLVINTNYVKTSIRFSGSTVADFKSTGIHLAPTNKIFGESDFAFLDLVEAGSSNTKLWNYYAYNIILGTNNAERLRLTSNGNFLINTTTDAGFRLDVNGTARVLGGLTVFNSIRVIGQGIFGANGINNEGVVGIDQYGTGSSARIYMCNGTGTAYPIAFDAGGNSYFNTGGNVGIGTSSPSYQFQVSSPNTVQSKILIGKLGYGNVAAAGGSLNVVEGGNDNGITPSIYISQTQNDFSLSGQLVFTKMRNNFGALETNETIGSILFQGANNSSLLTNAGITIRNDGAINSGRISFLTNNAGTYAQRVDITSDGNVLIGTSTNAGFRLDVNGTARVRGTSLTDYGFTVANSANNLMFFGAGASNGGLPTISSATGRLMIYPTEGTLNRYVDFSNTSVRFNQLILEGEGGQNNINLSVGGSGALRLTTTISTNPIEFFTNNNNRASITASTGNFLIGTTTDAGFRLDVNGTARVQSDMTILGSGTTFATYALTIQNSSSQNLIRFRNDGVIESASRNYYMEGLGAFYRSGAGTEGLDIGRASGTTMNLFSGTANLKVYNNAGVGINSTSLNTSAVLQADSTTRGFLPPRMTTTQKNAIATPAAGLMVYDTDLNRPCFYDGTTWITL